MTDAFEKWINSFNEDDYNDWVDNNATDAQLEKALNIRQPESEKESEELEKEQEYRESEEREQQKTPVVYTAPKEEKVSRQTEEYVPQQPIGYQVSDIPQRKGAPIKVTRVSGITRVQRPPIRTTPRPVQQRTSLRQKISRFFGRFRGKK
jgi:hypothetical protein